MRHTAIIPKLARNSNYGVTRWQVAKAILLLDSRAKVCHSYCFEQLMKCWCARNIVTTPIPVGNKDQHDKLRRMSIHQIELAHMRHCCSGEQILSGLLSVTVDFSALTVTKLGHLGFMDNTVSRLRMWAYEGQCHSGSVWFILRILESLLPTRAISGDSAPLQRLRH